jgi:hypothetical protein
MLTTPASKFGCRRSVSGRNHLTVSQHDRIRAVAFTTLTRAAKEDDHASALTRAGVVFGRSLTAGCKRECTLITEACARLRDSLLSSARQVWRLEAARKMLECGRVNGPGDMNEEN